MQFITITFPNEVCKKTTYQDMLQLTTNSLLTKSLQLKPEWMERTGLQSQKLAMTEWTEEAYNQQFAKKVTEA